jgi:hypothetical protein
VTDTTLDSSNADTNHGGSMSLLGGPGRTILIRFGDLNRVVGPFHRVRKASLVLGSGGGPTPSLRSVSRVLVPWGEGPLQTLSGILRVQKPAEGTPAKPTAPLWGATWRERRGQRTAWQQPGAAGAADAEPIATAKIASDDKALTITGLEDAVQRMAERWYENHGFAVSFETPTEVSSSQSVKNRPRLVLELEPVAPKTGADLSVVSISRGAAEGGEVPFTARVKNVGTAASEGFAAAWVVGERQNATIENPNRVEPGQEVTFTVRQPAKNTPDHRVHPIGLRIVPKGNDAVAGNDYLEVQENARFVTLVVDPKLAEAAKATPNTLGSRSVEDWAQEQVRTWNDVYLAHSRFSFATEGAKERVALQGIEVGQPGGVGTGTGNTLNYAWLPTTTITSTDTAFLRSLGVASGLPDMSAMSIARGRIDLKDNGKPVDRSNVDRFPGIMGYGDTRFEGSVPGQIGLPYEPYFSPIFEVNPLEPTGLLSATDVARVNRGLEGGTLTMPKTLLVRAQDLTGRPLSGVELSFFQTKDGRVPDGPPAFTTVVGTTGTGVLPNRGEFGPFGQIDPMAGNGTFLVRALVNGVPEWSWLKAWQLYDAASRGNQTAAIVDLRFNVPGAPLEADVDLARDRIITDSAGSLPAKLVALVDDSTDTEVAIGPKVGDWIEIDLGRDRTVGEVRLATKSGFLPRFDIVGYGTGQRAEEAIPIAKELDWAWTSQNRGESGPGGTVSVAYRGPIPRVRYLRILNRSGGEGKLAAIRIVPARVGP